MVGEEELLREKIAIHERSGGNKGSYLWNKNSTQKEVNAPSQSSCGTIDGESIGMAIK